MAQTDYAVLVKSIQDTQTCLIQMSQAIFAPGSTVGTCQGHLSLSMSKVLDGNDHSTPIKAEPDERSSHLDLLQLQSELQQCQNLNRSLHERVIDLEIQLEDRKSTYRLDDDAQSLRFNDDYNRLCRESTYAA